ncbi:MAG: cache domain-containing protein, partial [Pseudomonadota bacterium]|nr:cache domain-containing protein [Pseudomonadota bacterium]
MKSGRMKFTNLIRLLLLAAIISLTAIILIFQITGHYRRFNQNAEKMRADYVSRQKEIIKREVMRVVETINYQRSLSEQMARDKVRRRILEAHAMATNIYQRNKATKTDTEIQPMVIDALRAIRFAEGRGYYFVIRLDGLVRLNANKPQLEMKNLLGLRDTQGKRFIQEMTEIAGQFGQGFCEYYWLKPNVTGKDHKKISFIKRFEPFNWLIGTGLYVEDVEKLIKTKLLSQISKIRFGSEGYIFVNRLNGDALCSNGKIFDGSKKLWEVFAKNPESIKDLFAKEYNAALKPGGDYIYY